MAEYLSSFPTTAYSLSDTGEVDYVKNLTIKVGFDQDFKNNPDVYSSYIINDGETPEGLAHKEYGSTDKYWIILSYNDIIDPQFQWPLNYRVLHNLIADKYSAPEYANTAGTGVLGVNWAKTNVKEYYKNITHTELTTNEVTKSKIVITSSEHANTLSSSVIYTLKNGTKLRREIGKGQTYYYEYEVELNESKRLIKLPKTEFVESIDNEFMKMM